MARPVRLAWRAVRKLASRRIPFFVFFSAGPTEWIKVKHSKNWSLSRCLIVLGFYVWGADAACGHESAVHHHDGARPHSSDQPSPFRTTVQPDRIVLSWTGDPATSQAVSWRTSSEVTTAVACVAVATDGPKFADDPQVVVATTTSHHSDLGPAHYHTAVFQGLDPETTYAYRVGDRTNWSEWSHFTTASSSPKPFTFIYLGDAQNKIKSHCSRVMRESFRAASDAAFILHAGDLVGWGNSDADWGEWHLAASHLHRTIPCVATPGNHEYFHRGADGKRIPGKILTSHWRAGFAFPLNGPAEFPETVYYIDYQGVRFVSLDSNRPLATQVTWLDEVLRDNPHQWTIVTLHHPIHSASVDRDNPEIRKLLQPVFDRYQVDLVLQGHDHTYARSELMRGDAFQTNSTVGLGTRARQGGTVYVISVSGPKMYQADPQEHMRRLGEGIQLFQIIHVDASQIRYEARTATGRLFDAFSLKRSDRGKNVLVDRLPLPAQVELQDAAGQAIQR